jgi:hypothetical protein
MHIDMRKYPHAQSVLDHEEYLKNSISRNELSCLLNDISLGYEEMSKDKDTFSDPKERANFSALAQVCSVIADRLYFPI